MTPSMREVEREVAEAAGPTRAYFMMSGLSAVLASYGLLANSPAVIIGAMLVAMLLNPITGLSMALVTGDAQLIQRAAPAELFGALLVFAIGFAIGLGNQALPFTSEMLSRTDPSLLDLVIAVAGGTAASYAIGNPRLNSALAGVAIATALVPPLANAGILMAHGSVNLALGALVLYASNYASIVFSAMVVFWFLGHRPRRGGELNKKVAIIGRLGQITLFVLLAVHLAVRLNELVSQHTRMTEVEYALETGLSDMPGARLIEIRIAPRVAPNAIVATVRTPQPLTPSDVARLEARLPLAAKEDLRLRIRSIPVVVANSDGYLFGDDPR